MASKALAILAWLVVAACASVPTPTPAAISPTPTIPPSPAPSTTATGPATTAETDWGRITAVEQPALGDRIGSAQMAAVGARGHEVVAVGEVIGTGATAWYSPDGYSWSQADFPSASTSGLRDVLATDSGYVAVGFVGTEGARTGAAWFSYDGRTWTRATVAGGDGAVLRRVAAGGPGLVAQGGFEDEGTGQVAVWGSADGTEWSLLSPRGGLPDEGQVWTIAAAASGLVMAGSAFQDGLKAATWHSSDGRTWTRGADPEGGASVNDLALFNDRLIAVGSTEETADPVAWFSSDGATWEPAMPVPGSAGGYRNVYLSAVALGGRGVIAVGPSAEGTAGVWTSADGLAWIRIPNGGGLDSPPEVQGQYMPADVVAGGPGTVIVGRFPGASSWSGLNSAAVWTSPSPPVVSPAPTPTPLACPSKSHLMAVDVIDLAPTDQITCFGGSKLTFTAFVSPGSPEGVGPPAWLTSDPPYELCPVALRFCGGVVSMLGYRDPLVSNPLPAESEGAWFVITGHFDDTRSKSCVPFGDETPEQAVARCRHNFVMTSLAPSSGP